MEEVTFQQILLCPDYFLQSSPKMKDRLSNLPEELICYILSFLPTKEVVATSVLSKRWIPLWRSVSTLDFDDFKYFMGSKEDYYARFVQSLNAVILNRDLHHPIEKFSLTCHTNFYDPDNVRVWLSAVVQLRVQHLELSIITPEFLRLRRPTNLSAVFTCSTLVVLKLQRLALKPISSAHLPLLKVLHLEAVSFFEHQCLAQLLCGCPVLEDFKARCIVFYNHLTHSEFKTLPKLVRADISIRHSRFLLMEAVNNVEFLRVHEMEFIARRSYVFPKFHNLTHIELVYSFDTYDWLQVVELLKNCPKLQVLIIDQIHFHCHRFDVYEDVGVSQYPQCVPECVLLHLNRCYLKGYRGTNGECQLARYIMQNGKSLESMTISSGITIMQKEKPKMFEKLSSCPRSSRTCKLSFI